MPVRKLASRSYWNFRKWPDEYEENNPDFIVPIVYAPEDFVICVAGGLPALRLALFLVYEPGRDGGDRKTGFCS